mgnify:CR=1 FL=1|tara:strand:+ start:384 stop:647 length:264 start_codon:yes stop_codon:yes gene_type:complete
MSDNKVIHYGNLKEEKRAIDSIKAREIVQEILKFGVSQHQLTKIIYLLALELEDRILLETLSDTLRPLLFKEKDKNKEQDSVSIITE